MRKFTSTSSFPSSLFLRFLLYLKVITARAKITRTIKAATIGITEPREVSLSLLRTKKKF